MEYNKHPPELAAPPPEPELRREQEITAPPPEFGQGTAPPEEGKKKRGLRQLLAIPAVLLILFFCLHNIEAAPKSPELPTEPVPTAEPVPTETQPVETATEAPTLPQGSVILDVFYAVRQDEAVLYSYDLYAPIPSLDADQSQIDAYQGTPWPISVYAQVSDAEGKAVNRENDPDIWQEARDRSEYAINAAGLEGELTLTLTAVYEEEGEERSTVWTGTLAELPPAPALSATLERIPGTDEIDFNALLQPQTGDEHAYALEVRNMGQIVYDGEEATGLSLGDDPGALPVEGDSESGYSVRYSGGSALGALPEGLELSVCVSLEDTATGYVYTIESNRIETGPSVPTYPLESGRVVVTVYNDTTSYEFPSQIPGDDGYLTLLATEVFDAAEFTSYELPDPLVPPGYTFQGWVIHVNDPFDYGSDATLFEDYNGDPPRDTMLNETNYAFPVESILTREDLERVPPDAEGNRFVNVHAVWIKQDHSDELLLLDDGYGNVTPYSMELPLASEGYIYLCRYPVPTSPEGLTFDGWYDAEGNRVDLLMCFFSFYAELRDEDGNFKGYDWGKEETVVLTAHWR